MVLARFHAVAGDAVHIAVASVGVVWVVVAVNAGELKNHLAFAAFTAPLRPNVPLLDVSLYLGCGCGVLGNE